jgi:hypothetical protein
VNANFIYLNSPYLNLIEANGVLLKKFEKREPQDRHLNVAEWAEASIDAYAATDTIHEISTNKISYRKASTVQSDE